MKERKKKMSVLILLLLIGFITIGYAVLNSDLTITGTSHITNATWDVHFETISVTTGSVTATTAPTIASGGLSVTYEVTLTKPGDFYEFSVNVKNDGSVTAKLSAAPTISGPTTAQDVYTNYTFLNSDGTAVTAGQTIAAGASKTYKVRVEFDRNISSDQLPTTAQNMTLTAAMNWEQA